MSVVFLRVPGFESGWPSGLLHAIFGISSPTRCARADAHKHDAERSNSSRHFFIESPETRLLLTINFQWVPAGYSWISEATGKNRFRGARIRGEETQPRCYCPSLVAELWPEPDCQY